MQTVGSFFGSPRRAGDSTQPSTAAMLPMSPALVVSLVHPIKFIRSRGGRGKESGRRRRTGAQQKRRQGRYTCIGDVLWSVWKLPCDTLERSLTILQTD